jgi:S-formylglutathione hydrolase FrmB
MRNRTTLMLILAGLTAVGLPALGQNGSVAGATQAAATPAAGRRPVVWNNPNRPPIPGVTHGVLHSPSMDMEVGYNVYLPPGYAESTARYPVIYFLHGAGGNENSDAGGFSGLVRRETAAKSMPPAICVFPNGGMSGYSDHPETKVMGETLIIKELIPLIDATYRTIASRNGRVVAGFSMGGGGAVRLALKYPELFCAAGSWGGSLRPGPTSAYTLATENQQRIQGKVDLLLIVGEQDSREAHDRFVEHLKGLRIGPQYVILPGVAHNLGLYYEQTGTEMVHFLADRFASKR